MALQSSWVDALFARLVLRYGAAFLRQWEDASVDAVKADWARVLDGTSGTAIQYAIENLPLAPLNAMAFRALCRNAPAPAMAALPEPRTAADPERVRSMLAGLRRPDTSMSPRDRLVRNILDSAAEKGGKFSSAQLAQLRAMGVEPRVARREVRT